MTIFFLNAQMSFIPFPNAVFFFFFMICFKVFEDRQFNVYALIQFFWLLILTTAFNWGDQNYHKQNVKYILVISWILSIS